MAYVEPTDRATGLVVTAAIWNQDVAENQRSLFPDEAAVATWTPELKATTTDPVPGKVGHQYKVGALRYLWARFTFGGSGGSGIYSVDLPEAAVGIVASATQAGTPIGVWTVNDTSTTGNSEQGIVTLYTSTSVRFRRSGGSGSGRWVSNSVPFNIATDDVLTFSAHYPVA
jgi:hypothetical protein